MKEQFPEGVFINGVNTEILEAKKLAQEIGQRTGLWVESFYNPTGGFIADLLECFWNRFFGWTRPRVFTRRLAEHLSWNLANRSGHLHVFAHSQGCMLAMNAVNTLRLKDRQRIRMHLFAVTNLYEAQDIASCEYFLNEDDYVVANLVLGNFLARLWRRLVFFWTGKANGRGPVYVRRGGGHSLRDSYLQVLPEFSGYTESEFYKLEKAKNKEAK